MAGEVTASKRCSGCGGSKITCGVAERIEEIADIPAGNHPAGRPAYHYHVPLQMAPGLGGKTIDKLLAEFGTEMKLLHEVPIEEIRRVAGKRTALAVAAIRTGASFIQSGGGGMYGRIVLD